MSDQDGYDERRTLTINGKEVRIPDGAEVRMTIEIGEEAEDGEAEALLINLTAEGIITDAFNQSGDVVGTSSIMYDERYEQLLPKNVHKVIGRLQDEFARADDSLLDDIVHDANSGNASAINNEGIESQIEYIIQWFGEEEGERIIREALGGE
jgi:hypothetical protein